MSSSEDETGVKLIIIIIIIASDWVINDISDDLSKQTGV